MKGTRRDQLEDDAQGANLVEVSGTAERQVGRPDLSQLINWAGTLHDQGRYDEAAKAFQCVLDVEGTTGGAHRPQPGDPPERAALALGDAARRGALGAVRQGDPAGRLARAPRPRRRHRIRPAAMMAARAGAREIIACEGQPRSPTSPDGRSEGRRLRRRDHGRAEDVHRDAGAARTCPGGRTCWSPRRSTARCSARASCHDRARARAPAHRGRADHAGRGRVWRARGEPSAPPQEPRRRAVRLRPLLVQPAVLDRVLRLPAPPARAPRAVGAGRGVQVRLLPRRAEPRRAEFVVHPDRSAARATRSCSGSSWNSCRGSACATRRATPTATGSRRPVPARAARSSRDEPLLSTPGTTA